MELIDEDKVWNRAVLAGGGANPREGDAALAALMLAHGMVMNGGVEHAIEVLSPAEMTTASDGFRFFGLDEIACLLEEVVERGLKDEQESENADLRYGEVIPDDDTIVARFHSLFVSSPASFSPLEPEGG
jgi:hypothetical protein